MQRITEAVQKVSVVLTGVLIVLTGLKVLLVRSEVAQIEEIPDLEYKMAQMDGVSDTQPYVQVLNYLESKCTEENRTSLAMMARSMAELDLWEGEKVNNLEALRDFYTEADYYSEIEHSERVSCFDVWMRVREAYE